MTRLAETITSHTALFCTLSAVNHLFFSLICLLAVPVVFRISLRRDPLRWIAALLLSAAVGAARPFCLNGGAALPLAWETLSLLAPFVCAALLSPARSILKGMAAALGCSCLIDVPKYMILMLFFRYTIDDLDAPPAFVTELLLHVLFLLLLLALYARRERKNVFEPLLRLDPVLFVLIALSLSAFMASLVMFGSMLSPDRLPEFAFALTNLPLFAATAVYGVATTVRAKKAEETFRRELDRQILHYETMESVNEDLRLFRHDLLKKLRPMVAYLNENNSELQHRQRPAGHGAVLPAADRPEGRDPDRVYQRKPLPGGGDRAGRYLYHLPQRAGQRHRGLPPDGGRAGDHRDLPHRGGRGVRHRLQPRRRGAEPEKRRDADHQSG